MNLKTYIGIGVLVVIVCLIGVALVNQYRLNRKIKGDVEELLKNAETKKDVFTGKDLEGLPRPVKEYLDHVLKEGQPYINTVRLKQEGKFYVQDSWKSFTATQHYSIEPPGFVWNANIDFFPLITVRVVDMYKDGKGSLQGKLLSTLTVAEAKTSPEMNSAELARYLSEAVWFPTALLPGQGIEWEPVDENTARATLQHQEAEASLLFHFNDQNEITKVHTEERYRQEDNSFQPWTGYFENYKEKNGILIPLDGEVEWNLDYG
ncbi:hypothetical protein AKJ50_02180 [candidate division MSBL1 archaeon SCGC-AAA382A13]|uniref:Uncharacterized protein n=1 Tax=candidate division MSBL1 archaeon SCGC-AAA382A13 TaxID=1698279 RepID=A0A133VDV5_9EURY|nr:hypothetical protein AKJ50_02180 [candidate division MSBL1 archaeon SCGC-AAA382A13]